METTVEKLNRQERSVSKGFLKSFIDKSWPVRKGKGFLRDNWKPTAAVAAGAMGIYMIFKGQKNEAPVHLGKHRTNKSYRERD